MAGCFLDTTIVIHIAEDIDTPKAKGDAFLKTHQPATYPYYSLRELLAGHMRILCDTHNVIKAAANAGEALLALHRRAPVEGRKKEARLKVVASLLDETFTANPVGRRDEQKREILEALAYRINRLWRRAQKLKNVERVQSLSCFNDGKISYGNSGELRGPSNSFNCITTQRCAAAAYLYDNKIDLQRMIDALHPQNMDPKVAAKNENAQRRKALKELLVMGPQKFDKRKCRALGDAYFASMCPAGSVVATSNLQDHEPLCAALKKKAVEPDLG